jgi:hypothetical protein
MNNKKRIWIIDEAVPEGRLIVIDEEQYNELFAVHTDKTSEQVKEILDNYNKKVNPEDRMFIVEEDK